jgi:hypothetical protein
MIAYFKYTIIKMDKYINTILDEYCVVNRKYIKMTNLRKDLKCKLKKFTEDMEYKKNDRIPEDILKEDIKKLSLSIIKISSGVDPIYVEKGSLIEPINLGIGDLDKSLEKFIVKYMKFKII